MMMGFALWLPALAVHADSAGDGARRAQRIAVTTMSPFCPGKTIDACPSPKAGEWRADIRRWSEAGVPSREIRTRLQARVPGFDLSGRPGASWDWALPVGAVALATLWLVLLLRRLLRPAATEPTVVNDEAESDELEVRLNRELAREER